MTDSARMHYKSRQLSLPRSIHWAGLPGSRMLAWRQDALQHCVVASYSFLPHPHIWQINTPQCLVCWFASHWVRLRMEVCLSHSLLIILACVLLTSNLINSPCDDSQ